MHLAQIMTAKFSEMATVDLVKQDVEVVLNTDFLLNSIWIVDFLYFNTVE